MFGRIKVANASGVNAALSFFGLEKLALEGRVYEQALRNRMARQGLPVPAHLEQELHQIGAEPQTRTRTHIREYAQTPESIIRYKTPAERAQMYPSPEALKMTQVARKLPWATTGATLEQINRERAAAGQKLLRPSQYEGGEGHTTPEHSAKAEERYNRLLMREGQKGGPVYMHNPYGDPSATNRAIEQAFGTVGQLKQEQLGARARPMARGTPMPISVPSPAPRYRTFQFGD